jgi:hypothetical protein
MQVIVLEQDDVQLLAGRLDARMEDDSSRSGRGC